MNEWVKAKNNGLWPGIKKHYKQLLEFLNWFSASQWPSLICPVHIGGFIFPNHTEVYYGSLHPGSNSRTHSTTATSFLCHSSQHLPPSDTDSARMDHPIFLGAHYTVFIQAPTARLRFNRSATITFFPRQILSISPVFLSTPRTVDWTFKKHSTTELYPQPSFYFVF